MLWPSICATMRRRDTQQHGSNPSSVEGPVLQDESLPVSPRCWVPPSEDTVEPWCMDLGRDDIKQPQEGRGRKSQTWGHYLDNF